MGHKVHPKSLRLKFVNTTWDSSWFTSKKNYAGYVVQDFEIREELIKKFKGAGISKIEIGRNSRKIMVTMFTAKPGLVIGRQGGQVDDLTKELSKKYGEMEINVREIKKPELNAAIIADDIARQVEKRVAYRRAAKQAIQKAMQSGAKGIKVRLGGRLNGVDIARSETFKEGNIPLHTLRSVIDYSEERSNTIYGVIGIKVWVYTGESFKKQKNKAEEMPIVA